jgi:arylsulfatase A-like enzyme
VYDQVFCYFRDKQRMIRTDRWKLIHYPHLDRYQLFDLKADPLETKDLAGDAASKAVLDELKSKLLAWQREMNDPCFDRSLAP